MRCPDGRWTRAYDGAAIRDRVTGLGAFPDLPPRKTRRRRVVRRRGFHRDRDAVERMSGRPEDARRIAA